MNTIKTIDLWTEQFENHIECFSGAFVDGLENVNIPFDSYKVIKNCNCIITTNYPDLNITNKHNAIIFYKDGLPVRLMVINRLTDINHCIEEALNQSFGNQLLRNIYQIFGIKRIDVDLKQIPLYNQSNHQQEIDVGSCDRPSLLESMLEGSYTQSDTNYGKSNSDSNYSFFSNINIQYELLTEEEHFIIQHCCAFLNDNMTRIIPLQENSLLNIEEISSQFTVIDGNKKKR